MKTEAGLRRGQCVSVPFIIAFLCSLLIAIVPDNLHADGCFVLKKFVWDKHKDINEPTQKAIIVHDAGREDLILQVKYDVPVEEFGWLVPVPNLPTVRKGSMECFYELSKFTQKNLESHWDYATLSAGTHNGSVEQEPPVKVIEVKTVGAYGIAVLSTKDAGALENWLKENQFVFPPNAASVIDSYVKQQWYFIAVKINLKESSSAATAKQLASGELHPLQISFASERCVFPLKISSLNNKPTEVQVYVLSPEPLVERRLFEKVLFEHSQWRTNTLTKRAEYAARFPDRGISFPGRSRRINLPTNFPERDDQLGSRSEINRDKLIPFAQVGRKDLPVCSKEIALLNKPKAQWLTKQTWTFQPEEMRDLEFEPAIPVFTEALADGEGALAAANLMRLGTNGTSTLIEAMQKTNPVVRAHAMSTTADMFTVQSDQRMMNPELLKLLPKFLNDPDPEVRLHAVGAATQSRSPVFFDSMLKLLRDDYTEVSEAAKYYLREQQGELPKRIPLFRQMLQDTNVNVQVAGFQLLTYAQWEIPRADLVALFGIPRMELAGAAVGRLKSGGITCDEAKPLLINSLPMVRMMGLAILIMNKTEQSVELAIPLLKDPEEVVQTRAHDLLTDLTGQNFPVEQPEQWGKWWEQNEATFKVSISSDDLRNKQMERRRQRQRMEENSPP
jgi:HEAT repeat protein